MFLFFILFFNLILTLESQCFILGCWPVFLFNIDLNVNVIFLIGHIINGWVVHYYYFMGFEKYARKKFIYLSVKLNK